MAFLSVCLIWVLLALSSGLALCSYLGVVGKWPKISYVSALSNAMILVLYYAPSVYGYEYYFADLIKTVPLILLLVHLARSDPSPDGTYRGLCLVFILQIITTGWHILSSLGSPYYDQLSLATSIMELIVVVTGGFNVRHSIVGSSTADRDSPTRCSVWARRHHQGRG